MRRGLIAWSREEVPESALEARRARLQSAMRAQGLEAILIHTSFPRPAAVSWLTNFVPYWSEALLVVSPDGPPALLASLSKRVHGWIRTVSHMGPIVAAPHLGRGAAQMLERMLGKTGSRRIGVVGLNTFARTHAEPIQEVFGADCLVDASALFASVRQPTDAVERALAERASQIATAALQNAPKDSETTGEIAAAIERSARMAGAEDCIILIAPDLATSPVLRRIEGEEPLGKRYAVQLSLAYKTAWVRHAQSFSREGSEPASWHEAEAWFRTTIGRMSSATFARGAYRAPPGPLAEWFMEACIGPAPLTPVAAKGQPQIHSLPGGSLIVLTVRLDLPDGPWLRTAPAILGV